MSGPTSQRKATRSSFLERLKNWSDQESWRRFTLDYGRVIRASAVKAGLRSDEADDVVQETLLSVARSIPGFIYDRSKGTFEGWVCRIAQLRVIDHLRRRSTPGYETSPTSSRGGVAGAPAPSPVALSTDPFSTRWQELWRENALLAGMESLKRQTSPQHFQIFHMSVIDQIDDPDIARILGVSRAHVSVVRHRLARRLQKEIERFRAAEPPGA